MVDWRIKWGTGFLIVSLAFNLGHYLIFDDGQYILKFILAQLGFLPISVFLVTIVLNQLMARREKIALLEKINMVVGSFFSKVGTSLLSLISPAARSTELISALLVNDSWTKADYLKTRELILSYDFSGQSPAGSFSELRTFLLGKREFLLLLLGTPNLLEHDTFTKLLWAVFHLAEELGCRADLESLNLRDAEHLTGDVNRVSGLLLNEWLAYMQHLPEDYPFLFSLAVRTNPFDRASSAAID